MSYYATHEIGINLERIQTEEQFRSLLNEDSNKYLDEFYSDFTIQEGTFQLNDYFKSIHDTEKWLGILSAIAIFEDTPQQIKFTGEDTEQWGYKAYPDGKEVNLVNKWVEEEVK